jgi:copper(I)-binding protein
MLLGLKSPLKAGRTLPFAITVKFADGDTSVIRILAAIKPLETTGETGHMHMQMQSAAQPEAAAHQH